jgi:hypothetical protein
MRLFTKEQFAANPRACIIGALDWLDAAAGDSVPAEAPRSTTPARSALIEELDELTKTKGLEAVAEAIGVSPQTVRGWLHGTQPTESNRKRIEQFLSETSLPDAAGAKQSAEELFTQPQLGPE